MKSAIIFGSALAIFAGGSLAADEPRATTDTTSVAVPARPGDTRSARAYAVFETHCARCHQAGRLERPLASGGLANILSVDDLARDPVLIRPGLPDASRLYDVLENRHAPLDVFSNAAATPGPTPDDVEAIRGWIKDLDPYVQVCPARQRVRPQDVDAMMRDAQRLERERGSEVRFVSLVHLYNTCAKPAELTAYAQALNKLLNSLSRAGEPVKLTPLDAAGTVFSFRLPDFGWNDAQWDAIANAYPPALIAKVAPEVAKVARGKLVIVNGDWLAAAAAKTPLYYALLGIPKTLPDLANANGVDIDQNIRRKAARRLAIRDSAVTRGNRLLERHPGRYGGFWLVYDFATSTGDQDIFERPEGPASASSSKSPFKPDETRAIFSLPNGFYAYAIFDAAGKRVDRVLPGLEKAYAGVEANAIEPVTTAGANCFACHADGLVHAKDDFKTSGPTDTSAPPSPLRQSVMPLFVSESENVLMITADTDRYRAALKAAGVDTGLRIRGEELVTGLARRYLEDADFEAALGETGVERKEFVAELASATNDAAPLARRLLHGVLPRPELDRLFALLKGIDEPAPIASGGFLRDVKSEIGLSLWTDKPRLKAGDTVTITAEADHACYLTILSIDAGGTATVLFPNDFEPDNLIAPRQGVTVPPFNGPFQLRYKGEGTETVLARCSTSSAPPVGIEHDFVHQRFTVLGNWENFIQDTLVTDWELRSSPEKAERARIARAGALSRLQDRGEAPSRLRPNIATDKSLRDGRAVLVLGRD